MLRASFHLLGIVGVPPFYKWKKNLNPFIIFKPRRATAASAPAELLPARASSHSARHFRPFQMSASRSESEPDAASASAVSKANTPKISFCQSCGGATKQVIPDGEEKLRAVCTFCGKIYYENPKMVVGCLVEHDSKVLLCKRKIHPSYGLWTIPAGFMEIGESAAEGAARETLEEACAEVEILSPFAQLDIPRISQSYIIFRARLKNSYFSPGPESLECALYSLDDIPFDSLAFSSVYVTLKMYIEDIKSGSFKFHYCTINKRAVSIFKRNYSDLPTITACLILKIYRPGASPSDKHGFVVDHHLES